MSRDRLLVIDADMPKRLALVLGHRSRRAVTASKLNLAQGIKDGQLLRSLAALFGGKENWVLVTGDDNMPAEHGPAIKETEATIAVIHPERPAGISQHAWRIDLVHRWAHQMQRQEPQSVRRYTEGGSKVWTPRRRHVLEIARHGWRPWTPDDVPPAQQDGPQVPPSPPPEPLPGF